MQKTLLAVAIALNIAATPALAAEDLTLPEAMQSVLASAYEPDRHCGTWSLGEADRRYVASLLGSELEQVAGEWEICPMRLLNYLEPYQQKAMLLLRVRPTGTDFDCHACTPIIGAALFRRDPKGWVLQHQARILTPGLSGFGQPGEASLVSLGLSRYAVRLEGGYTGQGVSTYSQTLLAETQGKLHVIWSGVTGGDNEGTGGSLPHYSFGSKLIFVPRPDQAWPDLHQLITGTDLRDLAGKSVAEDVSGTRIYRFDGKAYRPLQAYASLGSE